MSDKPLLFTPLKLRELTLRNRVVIAPMCQYAAAEDGRPSDWHLVHLGRFATGGAGLVIAEASAVEPRGRITHCDAGIWSDAQAEAWKPIVHFIQRQGAAAAIQIAHAGRKASMQRPWAGNGPLNAEDAARGHKPWEIVAPSAEPVGPGYLTPRALTQAEIGEVVAAFAAAARRAEAAGFDALEIHGAHGYLIASFLSPVTNKRNDGYGGDRAGRMRMALETAAAVREAWPRHKPLLFRVSAVDGAENGWSLEDTVALAGELKARGVDVIDCSSGGLAGSATLASASRRPGFQVPYAAEVRRRAGVATQAVGLILDGSQAEAILQAGDADLIAIGREALDDPAWPHHAARELGADPDYAAWPENYGFWLTRLAKSLPPRERRSA
jgi:2,4-dienoyl-CoA reductase-like NADH-dependent reductase (Old Yellow Enzyme family)